LRFEVSGPIIREPIAVALVEEVPMRVRRMPVAALLVFLSCIIPARAQTAGALSPRNANYTIEVKLDPAQKMLRGSELISWRNDTGTPAGELRFHLYWNAWKNDRSTFMREAALGYPGMLSDIRSDAWSYCQVKSIRVLPEGGGTAADLRTASRYASPDDGNADDQTVLVVPLSAAIAPGQTVSVQLDWESRIPRTFSRTGFRGHYYFIAQWFPKLGVFQPDGKWNCHQFHASTEFFSDYGIYDVKMTVPRGWLLGATGVQQKVSENADGTSTHYYRESDVHDFVWTTSPDYREAKRLFSHAGLPPVEMRLLYQPEHESQVDRHFRATSVALQYYGTWYGAYPYGHITVIDPAWGSNAGGMEYPTLFTCGTRVFEPFGGGSPEGVTVHEAGHQFWYAMVGNNEFEDAWLDEGLNTFSTARAIEAGYGDDFLVRRFFKGFLPVPVRAVRLQRMTQGNGLDGYRPDARSDAEATPSYLYFPETGPSITYSKTALWLSTLERTLGWETLQRIMSTFFDRWKFRHPRPDDFFATASEISGRDLNCFFDQVYRKAAVFDYAIGSVSSDPVETGGFVDRNGAPARAPSAQGGQAIYETNVVARRLQDGTLPVDVLLKFDNGEEVRQHWDGQATWTLVRSVKPARLTYAVVDPERKILLDINYTNNSMLLDPKPEFAATKWASKWMIWLQDYMQTLAFLL
jgi:hypothetical protein